MAVCSDDLPHDIYETHHSYGVARAMAVNDNSKRVLDAIERLATQQGETRAENREALATLRAEVGFISGAVRDLTSKVDEIDKQKATRNELTAVETRMEKSVGEVSKAAAIEASKNNQEWTHRLDKIEDDVATVLEKFDSSSREVLDKVEKNKKEVLDKVEDINKDRWRFVGMCAVLSVIASLVLAWALRFIHL